VTAASNVRGVGRLHGLGRWLAWGGAALLLAGAVVALRQTQPPGQPQPAAPSSTPAVPVRVARFASDGVVLPEPGAPPAAPAEVQASRTGPQRLRVAWGPALPGGTAPAGATGYDVRWHGTAPGRDGSRLVAAPEVELDGLPEDTRYDVQVRSVDAFGRRSPPALARFVAPAAPADQVLDRARFTGLAEPFDGPFSVDTSVVGARWHLSGYPGCTATSVAGGMLAVDLGCGADLAVLRARTPMTLAPAVGGGAGGDPGGGGGDPGGGERGRVVLVTDAAGPAGALVVDLVPGPADRVGPLDPHAVPAPGPPASGVPEDSGAVLDPALPGGALRVLVDDRGARVLTGPGVPRLPAPPAPAPPPARGVGVLHVFELVLDGSGLLVLQDGLPVAAAGVAPPWTQGSLLVGLGGPPGRPARVRVDGIGFTGAPTPAPQSYVQPIVPATQRVLGLHEVAPGIGISRRQLETAAAARLVATVIVVPGVDLGGLLLQHGDVSVPVGPVLPDPPAGAGAQATVAADLPAGLLGPDGPAAVSPLVLRAPGADTATVPVTGSYLEIVPRPWQDVPPPGGGSAGQTPRRPDATALPRPSVRLLDTESREVSSAVPGARLIVEVTLDGLGGQLDGTVLAGAAGFQLWLDNRQIAGVPTAGDGPGTGGVYRLAVSTRSLRPGAHFVELRLLGVDPALTRSVLASWQLS
jgi:hypothetical protein